HRPGTQCDTGKSQHASPVRNYPLVIVTPPERRCDACGEQPFGNNLCKSIANSSRLYGETSNSTTTNDCWETEHREEEHQVARRALQAKTPQPLEFQRGKAVLGQHC
ncbi:hypothetical protein BDZ89DRAFT_1072431, partial [Hymenopellis radicata]